MALVKRSIIATRPKGCTKWFYSIIMEHGEPENMMPTIRRMKRKGTIFIHVKRSWSFKSPDDLEAGGGSTERQLPATATDVRREANRYQCRYIYWHDSEHKGKISIEPHQIIHNQ